MTTYLLLLRGINVGGKNKVSMADLRSYLEDLGYSNVSTYINSGNVIVSSDKNAKAVQQEIEELLPKKFKLDSELVRVLVLTRQQLQAAIDNKPQSFGDHPDKYHSDFIFLIGIPAEEAMGVFSPRDGVDKVWPGDGVVYSQRLSAERTKSRLNRIIGTPVYANMTIRNWNTVTKLITFLK
ncbi:DUF1697 domain-containing protein [Candidatus Saccharibacteria bacterium]|nr:MAG: DUF1697 domain-containing protein [Candidatus Saccharibacteria bacterium]